MYEISDMLKRSKFSNILSYLTYGTGRKVKAYMQGFKDVMNLIIEAMDQ